MSRDDIRSRVEDFAGGLLCCGVRGQRERSYDHCFNYFRTCESPTHDMEKSCAILGFYLASWGMYRGSTFLFRETNSTHFVPVVEYIERHFDDLARIDIDRYDQLAVERLREAYADLKTLLLPGGNTSLTLITKVMVGVFGCVPAYDTYFQTGARKVLSCKTKERFRRFSRASLELLRNFYEANKDDIDALQDESATWRFLDASPSGQKMTKAKIVDMYFFQSGYQP